MIPPNKPNIGIYTSFTVQQNHVRYTFILHKYIYVHINGCTYNYIYKCTPGKASQRMQKIRLGNWGHYLLPYIRNSPTPPLRLRANETKSLFVVLLYDLLVCRVCEIGLTMK